MAENDGKLYITISSQPISDSGKNGSGKSKEKEEENKFSSYAMHELMHFAKAQATQMVNYSIGNIGNFTGDYNVQREATQMLQGFNMLKSIGLSAYTGFKVAGTGGAMIGAGLAVASIGINTGLQVYNEQLQNARVNYSITQLRDLSGLNARTNGNR